MSEEMFGPQREYKQSEEQREKVRERVRLHRQRNRKDPAGKLLAAWKANLAALSESDRAALLDRERLVRILTNEMRLVCQAASRCRRAESAGPSQNGESIAEYLERWKLPTLPDELYREVQEFNRQFPTVRGFAPVTCAHYDGVLNDSFDDQDFAQFGWRTHVWELDWRLFVKAVLLWAEASPGDCDPEVQSEAKALCLNWYPWEYADKPEPYAPRVGVPQRTKAEETAHAAYLENAQAAQEAFDRSYRQHLIDQFSDGQSNS